MAVLGGLGTLVHVEHTAELACHLCEARNSELLLVYPIIVPLAVPLDAPLPELEAAAQHAIACGLAAAGRFGCRTRARIVRHRQPADAILDLARTERVETIVLGIRTNPKVLHDYDQAESAELEILHRAECEVIVVREPMPRQVAPVHTNLSVEAG